LQRFYDAIVQKVVLDHRDTFAFQVGANGLKEMVAMQATGAFRSRIVCVSATLLLSVSAAAQETPAAGPAVDPPGRVARIAYLQGNVSLEPSGVETFSQAEANYPLTAGDRVYADLKALTELQTAGLTVRLSNGADLTIASLTDRIAQFGLAQGSIRVNTLDLATPDGSAGTVEIDTPNGSVMVQTPGDLRVDSYPQSDTTIVTVTSGQVQITAPDFQQTLGPGQALQLSGLNPVSAQPVGLLAADALDRFDQQRNGTQQDALNAEADYVSPDMTGAADLAQYGDWTSDADYGGVWYPRAVPVGWVPYHNGHWAWVAPWGWTWVEFEPWGFAPFHYGRWNNFGGRWGWIPGPPPIVYGRPVPPVYSPALVAFAGGPGGGLEVTAWFPLGPRETYVPWYHASTLYVNRVNVTNIYSRNSLEVRNAYSNRRGPAFDVDVNRIAYVNRTVATTAVTQRDFAAGHSVMASQPGRLDASAREQLNQAPILPHPLVTPTASMAAPKAPARAVPPTLARPVLAGREGEFRTGGPVSPTAARPAVAGSTSSPPVERDHQPVYSPAPSNMARPMPLQPATEQPGRPLVNQTPPQPVQPPFVRQREAIERNDPGRPLGPQQVENLRTGRPAGPPAQPEASHQGGRPAPAPAPARQPPAAPGKPK
jgi:hypothetical protein